MRNWIETSKLAATMNKHAKNAFNSSQELVKKLDNYSTQLQTKFNELKKIPTQDPIRTNGSGEDGGPSPSKISKVE